MSVDAELARQLEQLRQQFASGLPKRFDAIDAAIDACRADPGNETPLRALMTVLHTLGGAAGIFGFAELGVAARSAEHGVAGWIADSSCHVPGIDELAAQVRTWRQQITPASQG